MRAASGLGQDGSSKVGKKGSDSAYTSKGNLTISAMDWMWDMRENAKSRMTPEQLEEWQCHFLVGMDGMGGGESWKRRSRILFELSSSFLHIQVEMMRRQINNKAWSSREHFELGIQI